MEDSIFFFLRFRRFFFWEILSARLLFANVFWGAVVPAINWRKRNEAVFQREIVRIAPHLYIFACLGGCLRWTRRCWINSIHSIRVCSVFFLSVKQRPAVYRRNKNLRKFGNNGSVAHQPRVASLRSRVARRKMDLWLFDHAFTSFSRTPPSPALM